jgi:ring-1,2-phenylacetyl-CoA epoxidase subunit PaaE
MSKVTAILDGIETTFELQENGETILNTAIDAGLDAPFSCKGGVCTTCMAKLIEGTVHMDANYALTDKEVKNGFILCCQSHPTSETVKFTWDL